MSKTIYTPEYTIFLEQLVAARKAAGLTQKDIADRLGQFQSFVSRCERGERRIDLIEARAFCMAIGIDFVSFVSQLEANLKSQGHNGAIGAHET